MTVRFSRLPSPFQLGTLFGITVAASVLTVAFWGQSNYQPAEKQTDQPRPAYAKQQSENPIARWWHWTLSGDSSGFYTLGLIGIGSLQAGFFVWQLILIRDSLKDTGRSADASAEQASIANKALIASQRPWIVVDVAVGGPITYDVNGFNVIANITLTNIGSTPAVHINIDVASNAPFLRQMDGIDVASEHDRLYRQAQNPNRGSFGFNVFPNRPITLNVKTSIGADRVQQITDGIQFMVPFYVGCVGYRSVFDKTDYQTTFAIDIQRKNTPRDISLQLNRAPSTIFPDEGDIPLEEIVFYKHSMVTEITN